MPTPSILWGPGAPPRSTEDSAGSTTTTRTEGLCFLSTSATPREDAAVPAQWTNASTSPPVWRQISSPSPWYPATLSRLWSWSVQKVCGARLSARAAMWSRFSALKASEVTMWIRYPLAAHSRPSASARERTACAIRSFMLPVGFSHSSFARMRAPLAGTTFWS